MKVKVVVILISLIVLSFVKNDLDKIDSQNRELAYKEKMGNRTRAYSMLGMKKLGADLILLQQTQNIGETFGNNRKDEIKKSSLEISQLNPYLLENYYASANVLAFIKTYMDYEGAQEILNRGMGYNPKDEFLKKYSAGMIASSKGDNEEILNNYEEIVQKYPDPLMVKVVYSIYFDKLKSDNKYLDKYLYYAEFLYNTKEPKYTEVVERDLKELGLKK